MSRKVDSAGCGGDGAFVNGDRGVVRVGDTIVLLTLTRDAAGRGSALPQLLTDIATHLTARAQP